MTSANKRELQLQVLFESFQIVTCCMT
ncbi:hypothetical protein LINGRAHAP2_LOCUS10205 [Linum grandiflorum]